jgi:hypothetical protein
MIIAVKKVRVLMDIIGVGRMRFVMESGLDGKQSSSLPI